MQASHRNASIRWRHTLDNYDQFSHWLKVRSSLKFTLDAQLNSRFLRVYALYKRNRYIGGFLLTYIVAELGVLLWLYLTPSITRESQCGLGAGYRFDLCCSRCCARAPGRQPDSSLALWVSSDIIFCLCVTLPTVSNCSMPGFGIPSHVRIFACSLKFACLQNLQLSVPHCKPECFRSCKQCTIRPHSHW